MRAARRRSRGQRDGTVSPARLTPRGLTRRDLLRLGPSVAAALTVGCRSQAGPSADREFDSGRIAGSIVGASHDLGHRLRAGDLPEPDEVRDVPVVIVGAGIAGLSAGWKLAKSDFRDFEILELEPQPGGNSRWGENAVNVLTGKALHGLGNPEVVKRIAVLRAQGPSRWDGIPDPVTVAWS